MEWYNFPNVAYVCEGLNDVSPQIIYPIPQ